MVVSSNVDLVDGDVSPDTVVAGHICLDIIPVIPGSVADRIGEWRPGSLNEIGPALLSTGGAVSNTGLALHALGFKTRLMGKIADDPFGLIIRRLIEARGPQLADSMIVSSGEQSSYTIVISQPGRDRLFLHHSGANDSFGADDLDLNKIAHSRLFHFGYPPLMRRFYNDGGAELTKLFRNVQSRGLTTSMDMAQVDLASEAAKVDWLSLLRKVLPHVDVFLPSLEEILFMLGRERTDVECCSADLLRDVASTLISWGAAIVGLKLGSQGLFLQTSGSEQRMNNIGRCKPSNVKSWIGRQLLAPCFEVEVEGTTGAGDCTIAGFLAGLLAQQSAEDALISAVATGACCVERSDAVSGVPMWEDLQRRIQSGWRQHKPKFQLSGWKPAADRSVIFGPEDPFRAV